MHPELAMAGQEISSKRHLYSSLKGDHSSRNPFRTSDSHGCWPQLLARLCPRRTLAQLSPFPTSPFTVPSTGVQLTSLSAVPLVSEVWHLIRSDPFSGP